MLTLPTSAQESRRKKVVITESSVITYTAYAPPGTETDADGWEIHRQLTQGDTVTTDVAFGVLDDRESLFDAPDLTTTLSLGFDGINDYVNFGNTFNYDAANQWSCSVWIKPDNIAAGKCIWSKSTTDASVDGLNLQFVATTGLLQLQARASGGDHAHTSDLAVTASTWQHIVFTWSGSSNVSGARLYRNAVVGATPSSGAISGTFLSGQDFNLGARNPAFPFSGNMCHFSVWSKALSAAEVTEIYNSGVPSDLNALSFVGDLVTWCRLGDGDSYPLVLDSAGSNNGTLTNMASDPFEADVP